MKSLISKSIALARYKTFDEHPYYVDKSWLQGTGLPGQVNDTESWVGGNPRLPEPFLWPSSNGKPYQFICQINCAQIPKRTWGQLGPRKGWFAVFFGVFENKIDIKIIYTKTLGSERRALNSQNENLAWHNTKEQSAQYLGSAVAWPLKASTNNGVESKIESQRPFVNIPKSILDPKHLPASWDELSLLLDCVKLYTNRKCVALTETADELKKQYQYKNPILDEIIDRRIKYISKLEARFLEDSKHKPFGFEPWAAQSSIILDILLSSDEYQLENGYPLVHILKKQHILNLWYSLSHFIPKESATFDDIKLLAEETIALSEDLSACRDFPVVKLENGKVNLSGWREYKKTKSRIWNNFSQRIRSQNKKFYSIILRHMADIGTKLSMETTVRPELYVYSMFFGKVPKNWDETLLSVRKRKKQILALKGNVGQPTDFEVNQLAKSKSVLPRLQQLEKYISECQKFVQQKKMMSAFKVQDWMQLFQTLEDSQNDSILDKSWPGDYASIRANMAKQNYSLNNSQIYHSNARQYYENLWRYDSQDFYIQLGGMPRGMCNEFSNKVPKAIMLMQIPTNCLTDTMFGDMSDLVISVPAKSLKRNSFKGAFADIPN